MTEYTRFYDRFEYHTEDLDCSDCLFYKAKSERENKQSNHGCGEDSCRFDDIRREAEANGRIKRPRGWFKICRE